MRLAKFSRTLLLLALPLILATCALAQDHPNVQPNAVRQQLMTPPAAGAQSQPAPQTPPTAPPMKGKKPVRAAAPMSPKSAKAPVEKPADGKTTVARRDPFDTLLNKAKAGNAPPENLPPGKAGLIVDTLKIDGVVKNTGSMVAIVSNPQQRVYFLKEGDKLYDGSVDKITLDAVSFHAFGKDAFGKTLERQVTKRLYPSPGEQQ